MAVTVSALIISPIAVLSELPITLQLVAVQAMLYALYSVPSITSKSGCLMVHAPVAAPIQLHVQQDKPTITNPVPANTLENLAATHAMLVR